MYLLSRRWNSLMVWNTCVNVSVGLTDILCTTAFTLVWIHRIWSQTKRNPVFERKEVWKTVGRAKDKTDINLWICWRKQFAKFSLDLQTMRTNKRKREVGNLLRQWIYFLPGLKYLIKKDTNTVVQEMNRVTIKSKNLFKFFSVQNQKNKWKET